MVYETHYVKDNLNPDFQPFTITGQKLCKNNLESPMKMEIWDHSNRGFHTWISQAYFTVMDIVQGRTTFIDTYDKKNKFSGRIIIEQFIANRIYSMVDLLKGGLDMNLYIAIDFTGSNGLATSPNSLHFMNPSGQFNQYQQAILAVGSILQLYDSDKQIPVYGFGAKWPQAGLSDVSHCFPLSGNPSQPFAQEIDGVFQMYRNALPGLSLWGPTNFAPCIIETTRAVAQSSNKFCYSVLLILTDGLITDVQDTVDAIVNASNYPMSIIIVGVGNEDFSQMEYLDADKGGLKGRSGYARRDIVQFVAFNQVNGNVSSLAAAVLQELPNQISSYFRVSGIKPPI